MSEAILEVVNLTHYFGGLPAVNDVSFSARRGEILGIIGPNGAGKTTLFNLITSTIPASKGKIHFDGQDVTRRSPDQVARSGLIRTFQAATIFRHETVLENLRRGALFGSVGRPGRFLNRPAVKRAEADAAQRAAGVLEFVGLRDVAERLAGDLPYGKQKICGVGIALAAQPKQLLMDEPAAGLSVGETVAMGTLISRIRREFGISVILVEHDLGMVRSTCDRVVVLNYGRLIADGTPDEVCSNEDVVEAYLGGDVEDA